MELAGIGQDWRFKADNGVWRVAFAFDPERKAVLLVGDDKSGGRQKKLYNDLIKTADVRFDRHLSTLKKG